MYVIAVMASCFIDLKLFSKAKIFCPSFCQIGYMDGKVFLFFFFMHVAFFSSFLFLPT